MAGGSKRPRRPRSSAHDDDFAALLAAGLLVAGFGLAAASAARHENERRREAFRRDLRERLAPLGVDLVAATLGRGANNAPFWNLTVQWPMGELFSFRVPLPMEASPYSDQALDMLAAQFERELAANG